MTDPATLQTRLTEAETALHALAIGGQEVEVDIDGVGRVKYTAARIGFLRSYIAELKQQLGPTTGGPLWPLFGA